MKKNTIKKLQVLAKGCATWKWRFNDIGQDCPNSEYMYILR